MILPVPSFAAEGVSHPCLQSFVILLTARPHFHAPSTHADGRTKRSGCYRFSTFQILSRRDSPGCSADRTNIAAFESEISCNVRGCENISHGMSWNPTVPEELKSSAHRGPYLHRASRSASRRWLINTSRLRSSSTCFRRPYAIWCRSVYLRTPAAAAALPGRSLPPRAPSPSTCARTLSTSRAPRGGGGSALRRTNEDKLIVF